MSKIKMLLDVVQDMRSLTDSLEALARAIEEPEDGQSAAREKHDETQPVEQMPSAPVAANNAPEAPKSPTLVELRAFVAARSTPQTRPRIRALLAGHGVAKLTDLPESAYLDLMREVEAL